MLNLPPFQFTLLLLSTDLKCITKPEKLINLLQACFGAIFPWYELLKLCLKAMQRIRFLS